MDDPEIGLDDPAAAAGAEDVGLEAGADGGPGMGADVPRMSAADLLQRVPASHQENDTRHACPARLDTEVDRHRSRGRAAPAVPACQAVPPAGWGTDFH